MSSVIHQVPMVKVKVNEMESGVINLPSGKTVWLQAEAFREKYVDKDGNEKWRDSDDSGLKIGMSQQDRKTNREFQIYLSKMDEDDVLAFGKGLIDHVKKSKKPVS